MKHKAYSFQVYERCSTWFHCVVNYLLTQNSSLQCKWEMVFKSLELEFPHVRGDCNSTMAMTVQLNRQYLSQKLFVQKFCHNRVFFLVVSVEEIRVRRAFCVFTLQYFVYPHSLKLNKYRQTNSHEMWGHIFLHGICQFRHRRF